MDIYGKQIIEWITVAVETCAIFERHREISDDDLTDKLLLVLPLLYLKTRIACEVIEEEEAGNTSSDTSLSEVEYEYLRTSLAERFGEHDTYIELRKAATESDEETLSTLSEDLADIYQGVKELVNGYAIDNDEVRTVALSEGKYFFFDHWGERLLNALRILHNVRKEMNEKEDEYRDE